MTAREACIVKIARPSGTGQYSMYCIEDFRSLWDTPRLGRVVALDITLERRIRELSAQAVATQDADELRSIVSELQGALHEHSDLLKLMLSQYPFVIPDLNKPAA